MVFLASNPSDVNLPDGWALLTLKDVAAKTKNSIKRGPFGSAVKKEYFVPHGYKVYEQKNAIYDNFALGHYYINEQKFLELRDFELKANDIIVSCSGTIGKAAVAPENIEQGIINQALLKITLNKSIVNSEYFALIFGSQEIQKEINGSTRGTAITNVSPVSVLKQILFPIPPLNEQNRIVAQLKNLYAQNKINLEAIDKIPQLLRRFRQSILEKAFKGQLTPNNPDDNSAFLNIANVIAARKQKNILKGLNEEKREPLGLFNIPNNWTWVDAEQVCWKITDGEHNKPITASTGIPLLSAKNIRDGYLDFSDTEFVDEDIAERCWKRAKPEVGDILIVSVGATIGRLTLLKKQEKFCFQRSVGLFKPIKEVIDSEYFYYFLKSNLCQQQIASFTRATAISVFIINRMKRLSIPLAPLEEQRQLTKKVKTLFESSKTIEENMGNVRSKAQMINQSLIEKAFRGELVPQDPNDEPVSELLQRLKAEK